MLAGALALACSVAFAAVPGKAQAGEVYNPNHPITSIKVVMNAPDLNMAPKAGDTVASTLPSGEVPTQVTVTYKDGDGTASVDVTDEARFDWSEAGSYTDLEDADTFEAGKSYELDVYTKISWGEGPYQTPIDDPAVTYIINGKSYTSGAFTEFTEPGIYAGVEITATVAEPEPEPEPPATPTLVEGDNDVWTKGSTGNGLSFKTSASYSSFQKVEIGNIELKKDVDYTVSEGSTIVLLKPSYLNRMAAGSYNIKFFSSEGDVAGKFQVKDGQAGPDQPQKPADKTPAGTNTSKKSPKTGADATPVAATAAVLAVGALVAGSFLLRRRDTTK